MMKQWKALSLFVLVLVMGFMAGCGQTDNVPNTDGPNDLKETVEPNEEVEVESEPVEAQFLEPVELTIVPYYLAMSDEEFEELLFDPLKAVHPHITMKVDRTDPVQLAASGSFPDMFYVANVRYYLFKDMDIPFDLSEMIKKSRIDLNAFAKPNIDWIVELSAEGEVYGLPFDLNQRALYYNKDIFDTRGIPYPEDGMTWNDLLELSRKLTFVENNTQYRGFIPPNPNVFSGTKRLPVFDETTRKVLLHTNEYQSILELVKSFYEIPGIIANNEYPIKNANFLNDQTVAMSSEWLTDMSSRMTSNNIEMNYDIVGMPSFHDLPGVTNHPGAKMMGISKSSQHKDDAFMALEYFVSPEVQIQINRRARLTALADENIRKDFGADMEVLKGKNIAGALQVQPAKMLPPHEYVVIVDRHLNAVVADLAKGTKDVNTLLREAQEAAEQEIAEAEKNK